MLVSDGCGDMDCVAAALIKAFTIDRIRMSSLFRAWASLSSSAIRSATASGVKVIEVAGELVGDVDGVADVVWVDVGDDVGDGVAVVISDVVCVVEVAVTDVSVLVVRVSKICVVEVSLAVVSVLVVSDLLQPASSMISS